MLPEKFVLSSHDFSDCQDRICTVISRPKGQRDGSRYALVDVAPSVMSAFWDEPEQGFDRLILSEVGSGTIDEIGEADILVDIVLCPSYVEGAVDERQCSRIGTGSLHSYAGE